MIWCLAARFKDVSALADVGVAAPLKDAGVVSCLAAPLKDFVLGCTLEGCG
jgi:hypothetical protein